jgi:CHAD domain-containing protein
MPENESLEDQVARVCASFEVDWEHSQHVARLADRLFRQTRHLHGLTKTARPWLKAAALLHDITLSNNTQNHHLTAAQIIPELRIPGLGASAKRIIATAVRFHPRNVGVESYKEYLSRARRPIESKIAGRLTAILRIADGLDHSRTYTNRIAAVHDDGKEVVVLASGDSVIVEDTSFTNEKTDFWNTLFLRPIRTVVSAEEENNDSALISPEITVAEAVRRIFQQQIEQLLSLEYGLAYDHDVEYVHEMRVATRRLRTALSLLGKSLADHRKGLRNELSWIATVLGNVRDCDVFLLFLREYMEQADERQQSLLRGLIGSEHRLRRGHYADLLKAFGSQRYTGFRDGFHRMAQSPIGSPEGMQPVGKRASRLVWRQARKTLKQRYDQLAPYGRSLKRLSPDRKHQLRISCKKLRYTAEFFSEVYPKQLRSVIGPMAKMQDLLGEVHDMDVWNGRIRQHVQRQQDPAKAASREALDSLLRHLDSQKENALRQAEDLWNRFTKPARRRKIRKLIASPKKT